MTKNRNKNKNKILYSAGDCVMIQNFHTKDFLLNGTVESQRTSDDVQVVSYCINTDKGFHMTRHRHFLRPLGAENDPKISKESVDSNNRGKTTDLPIPDDIIGPDTPRAPSGELKLRQKM